MSAAAPPHLVPPKNGLGTAGFVLGLLAALFALVPLIGMIAWPLGILGLIFSITGIGRARSGAATNGGLAISGTVLAAVGLLLCFAWVGAVGSGVNRAVEQAQPTPAAGLAPPPSPGTTVELGFGQAHTWSGGEIVQVPQPRPHVENNPFLLPVGKRAVEVDITITNRTGNEINPLTWDITAAHRGRPAQPVPGDASFSNVRIPPGGNLTVTRAFQIAPEHGQLRVSVRPNVFAQKTAYYVGDF